MKESSKFKREARTRRQTRVRRRVRGTAECPRLNVFRSNRHMVAQLIDDEAGVTIVSASSIKMAPPSLEGLSGKVAVAKSVGLQLAKAATEKGVSQAVFDRAGFKYHGRVAALADGAREGGLRF